MFELIDVCIVELDDWCGDMFVCLCVIVWVVDFDVVEEWKWSVFVWLYYGLICIGEVYK